MNLGSGHWEALAAVQALGRGLIHIDLVVAVLVLSHGGPLQLPPEALRQSSMDCKTVRIPRVCGLDHRINPYVA